MAATTFPCFIQLPPELRAMIWTCAADTVAEEQIFKTPLGHWFLMHFHYFMTAPYKWRGVPFARNPRTGPGHSEVPSDGTNACLSHPKTKEMHLSLPAKWYETGWLRLLNTSHASRLATLRWMRQYFKTPNLNFSSVNREKFRTVLSGIIEELEQRLSPQETLP